MAMTPFYANKREDEKCLHTKNYHLISNVEYLIFWIHSQTETDSQIYWSEWSLTSDFKKNVVSIWTSEFSIDLYRLLGISLYGREKKLDKCEKGLDKHSFKFCVALAFISFLLKYWHHLRIRGKCAYLFTQSQTFLWVLMNFKLEL